MSSFRGHYNDEFENEQLKLLHKREIVAIRTLTSNKTFRATTKLKEEAMAKRWEKKMDHKINNSPQNEVDEDMSEIEELQAAKEKSMISKHEKELGELLNAETARHNLQRANDSMSFFEELLDLKVKNDR